MRMENQMADRACCDNIVKAEADILALKSEFEEYRDTAQIWRDHHAHDNAKAFEEIRDDLKDIKKTLTTWVNPIIVVVISVLCAALGWALS